MLLCISYDKEIDMRILGIDYGDRRVGVAVSDLLGLTAQGVGTVVNKGLEKLIPELKKIIDEYTPSTIVIGLPKNMDGTIGFRGEATYQFADALRAVYDGEIVFQDERLTTVSAANVLNQTNTRGKDRKNVIDTVSACFILETYLNKLGK